MDSLNIEHVNIYSQLNMNASQFSKIYRGAIKKPQKATRQELERILGVEIKSKGLNWEVIFKDQQTEEDIIDGYNTEWTLNQKREALDTSEKKLRKLINDYRHLRNKNVDNVTLSNAFDGIRSRIIEVAENLK